VLLGVAAFAIPSIGRTRYQQRDPSLRQCALGTVSEICSWLFDRFVIFSFAFDAETGKEFSRVANKGAPGLLFSWHLYVSV
jgi:hypothetical protein